MCLTYICIIPKQLSNFPKSNEATPNGISHLPFSILVINGREEFYDRPTHPPALWQRRDMSSLNSDFFHSIKLLGCAHCFSNLQNIEIKNYCLSGIEFVCIKYY